MTDNTEYPYSLKFSLGSIFLMVLLMLLLFRNVVITNTTITWVVFGVCLIIFIFLIGLLVIKRLIPALKGEISLGLNNEVLIDYIRNITIDWKDIKGIKLIRGRSASTLSIDLKWESEYGTQIDIPLRWVKGKDGDIYNTVMSYLDQNEIVN